MKAGTREEKNISKHFNMILGDLHSLKETSLSALSTIEIPLRNTPSKKYLVGKSR